MPAIRAFPWPPARLAAALLITLALWVSPPPTWGAVVDAEDAVRTVDSQEGPVRQRGLKARPPEPGARTSPAAPRGGSEAPAGAGSPAGAASAAGAWGEGSGAFGEDTGLSGSSASGGGSFSSPSDPATPSGRGGRALTFVLIVAAVVGGGLVLLKAQGQI